MFIDESFACFLFLWVKGIYFGYLRNKGGLKVNGVVIWLVGRKNVVGLLGEHAFEV